MSKFVWTTSMDAEFLQAMIREKDKGNRIDGSFTSQAYSNMVEEFSKIFKRDLKKDHLKNRLRTLKDHFAQFYDIFRGAYLSGFSWDPTTKLLGAEEEVWEALIRDNPEAEKWKTKPINNYEEMVELFAKDRATGGGVETAKDRRKRVEDQNPTTETIEDIDDLVDINDITLENFKSAEDIRVAAKKMKLPCYSKNKKRKIEEEEQLTSVIMESIKHVADAIDRSTKVIESSRSRVYTEEEIYNELELMGMEPDDLSDAYLFLVDHPEKARAVFGCPPNMRVNILGKMMGSRE